MGRPGASTIRTALVTAALAIRLVAVIVLVAGPWTDEVGELEGWDAARFQAIAERAGAAWVDEPVEYPPGSVVAIDLLAGGDTVATNRRLVLLSAVLEGCLVLGLWRRLGSRAATAWLVAGLPLVPMGYLRFDMAVTVIAAAAALAILPPLRSRPDSGPAPPIAVLGLAFAVLVAAGAAIKVWPALLIAAALAIGQRLAAGLAAALGAVAALGWLAVVGAGLDPLDQVLSLRGVTGWHVESLPGAIATLAGADDLRFEQDAYRIGQLDETVVTGGRAIAVVAIAALTWLAIRRSAASDASAALAGPAAVVHRFGTVMLGATAALLVTAPLLSPQFVLWLTPWVCLVVAGGADRRDRAILASTATAIVVTGLVLTIFGPPRLAEPLPALILTVRNLALIAIVASCTRRLAVAAGAGSEVARRRFETSTGRPAAGPERRPTSSTS